MLACHFGALCGAAGILNIKQQPDVDNGTVSIPFYGREIPVERRLVDEISFPSHSLLIDI